MKAVGWFYQAGLLVVNGKDEMNGKQLWMGFARAIFLVLCFIWFAACASGPTVVDHAFEFSASSDSPGVEVLDFCYGDSGMPGTRASPDWVSQGNATGGTGVNGPMPVGDSLYVKWRIKATGAVYEDTVDLKSRFPQNITGWRIYFVIDGGVFVYLISGDPVRGYLTPEEVAAANREMVTPHKRALRKFIRHKVVVLYPDQSNHH